MRYLYYTNYQSGNSGLSNGIMSIENGVILAHLTNRLLVLDGNLSPPANIVAYHGRVNNQQPSRITDLLDIPVPWIEPDEVDLQGLESLELTNLPLWDFAFYFPKTMNLSSNDAKSFARDRNHWLTVTGEHDRVPVLRLSENPLMPGTQQHRRNLGYYSYQFYFDNETRQSVYRLLQRMQAKRPFAELAERVARDIGPFNAVHLRRGDFKVTYGVTTLDRKSCEAIEAMDQVFERKDPLVILTDERDDPFFMEIKLAYPDHYFIDWHILDNYDAEFARLPQTDSLSLAYLSQLVAAEAKEFIGTMTSTFTGLIQRYRGSRGKHEVFRYLWNELPESGQEIERGQHAYSECIPLDRGEMIEQFQGPYSWNRVSQLINPAWMREWPESFLIPITVATGALAAKPSSGAAVLKPFATSNQQTVIHVTFENLQVAVWSDDAVTLQQLAPEFGAHLHTQASNVIANFEISVTAASCWFGKRGLSERTRCDKAQLPVLLKQQIGMVFAMARHEYSWLGAAALAKAGRGLVIAGDTGGPNDSLLLALLKNGWELLDGGLLAIRIKDLMILPLGARAQPEGAAAHSGRMPTSFTSLVVAARSPLHVRDAAITSMSPATAVAALIGASLDFKIEKNRAVNLLCRLVEQRPTAQLHWNRPQEAARLLSGWADTLFETAA